MNTACLPNESRTGAGSSPAVPAKPESRVISRPPPPRPQTKMKTPSAYLWAFGFALIGAACGYFGMRFGGQLFVPLPGPKWLLLFTLGGLPFAWLIAVGIHEFGHVIGGWLGGGKFLLWLVGPVMVRRTPTGIRASWNRMGNLSGGLSACIPLDPNLATPRRDAFMTLAGPAASLMLAAASLWFACWLAVSDHPLSPARAILQHLVLLTALFSMLILMITALPIEVGGFKSDGKRVLELLRGGARSEHQVALLVLTAANLAGIRPAEYHPALVAKAVSLKDGSLYDLYGHLTVYYHAADREEWSAAQAHLDFAMAGEAKMTPFVRDVLRAEYAWLLATQTGDTVNARLWLDSAGKLDFDPAIRLRAQAAILLAEGKNTEAGAKAREGLHALKTKSLSPTENPFAVEALEFVIGRAGEA